MIKSTFLYTVHRPIPDLNPDALLESSGDGVWRVASAKLTLTGNNDMTGANSDSHSVMTL